MVLFYPGIKSSAHVRLFFVNRRNVDPPLRVVYRQQDPLRKLWRTVSSGLRIQLGLEPDEIENMILFRMGNDWLYQLVNAIENQNIQQAEELELQLERLLRRS